MRQMVINWVAVSGILIILTENGLFYSEWSIWAIIGLVIIYGVNCSIS